MAGGPAEGRAASAAGGLPYAWSHLASSVPAGTLGTTSGHAGGTSGEIGEPHAQEMARLADQDYDGWGQTGGPASSKSSAAVQAASS